MTEAEAKTKWCPFARQVAVVIRETGACATANRDGGEHYGVENVNCIGSACMAWRWSEGPGRCRIPPGTVPSWKGWSVTDAAPDESGNVEVVKIQTAGYCGLAGTPT